MQIGNSDNNNSGLKAIAIAILGVGVTVAAVLGANIALCFIVGVLGMMAIDEL